jgi:hypothetical protein
VFLQIDEHGYVDCGYCDRRFVLIGGPGRRRRSEPIARSSGWRERLIVLYRADEHSVRSARASSIATASIPTPPSA